MVHLGRILHEKRVCTLKIVKGSVHTEQYFRDRKNIGEKPVLITLRSVAEHPDLGTYYVIHYAFFRGT